MAKSDSLFSAKKTSSKMFGRFLNMSLMQLYTVFIDRSLTGHSIYLLVQVNILRFKYSITIRSSVTGKFMSWDCPWYVLNTEQPIYDWKTKGTILLQEFTLLKFEGEVFKSPQKSRKKGLQDSIIVTCGFSIFQPIDAAVAVPHETL